jgi:hypothetical protein
VVVIGGGFIGLEVAAGARKLGAEVTVLEGLPRLMSRVTAPIVSEAFERLHRAHGVELVFGAQVTALLGSAGVVEAVHTADGREYPAGCVVVGIGVVPDDRLAAAAGLACERGIIVDDCARSSDASIVAAGDCTARRLPDGRLLRLESVQNAVEQAKAAASALMGRERPFRAAPWFWSDQYDIKLQMVGLSHGYDQVVTRGDLLKPAFSAFYFQARRLIACSTTVSCRLLNRPRTRCSSCRACSLARSSLLRTEREILTVVGEHHARARDREHTWTFGQRVTLVHAVHVDQRVAIAHMLGVDVQIQSQVRQVRATEIAEVRNVAILRACGQRRLIIGRIVRAVLGLGRSLRLGGSAALRLHRIELAEHPD